MEKFIILMWLCSVSTTINCEPLKTDRARFADQYSCTVYGYSHSTKLIKEFGRKKVNQHNIYTKFLCAPESYMKKKETNA